MKLTNLFQQHGADRTLGSWSFKKVVRCGLTPKFKDVPNLVNMLTYEMGGPKVECGVPYDFDGVGGGDPRVVRYSPPTPEFELVVCTVSPGEELTLPSFAVPALLLVIEGAGCCKSFGMSAVEKLRLVMRPGRAYFLPARSNPPLTLAVSTSQRGPLRVAIGCENQHYEEACARLASEKEKEERQAAR